MKAPEFIKLSTGSWYEKGKPINDLKVGDKIFLCFGKERRRETEYEVTLIQDRGDKTKVKETTVLHGIELTRINSSPGT